MPFYGHTPQAKDYSGIGTAIGQMGAGIGAGVQEIETKRAEAVKAAQNREDLENAIRGLRSNYKNYGKQLIDKGALDQQTFQRGLDSLRLPTRRDYENPEAYLKEMEEKVANAYKVFAGKEDLLLVKDISEAAQRAKMPGVKATGEYTPTKQTETGFQMYEPKFEQTRPAPTTKEEYTAAFGQELGEKGAEAEAEGMAPMRSTAFQSQLAGFPKAEPSEKDMTPYQKESLKLQKARLDLSRQQAELKKNPTPANYDKVLQTTISNKNSAFSLNARYDSLIKATKQAIASAKGGAIEQATAQKLQEQFANEGINISIDVPSLTQALDSMELTQATAEKDMRIYEQQLKEIKKADRPTQLGTYKAATAEITKQDLPKHLDELAKIRGFAYYSAEEPMLSGTGEINISHPKIQDAILQKLIEGETIEDIAKGLQEETAFIGKQ